MLLSYHTTGYPTLSEPFENRLAGRSGQGALTPIVFENRSSVRSSGVLRRLSLGAKIFFQKNQAFCSCEIFSNPPGGRASKPESERNFLAGEIDSVFSNGSDRAGHSLSTGCFFSSSAWCIKIETLRTTRAVAVHTPRTAPTAEKINPVENEISSHLPTTTKKSTATTTVTASSIPVAITEISGLLFSDTGKQ